MIKELKTEELLLGSAIEHLFPGCASLDVVTTEEEIAARVLSEGAPVRDAAEAAALYGVGNLVPGIMRVSLELCRAGVAHVPVGPE